MSGNGDDGDDVSRGNTDHDPKPEFASRRNALPRGIGAPAPSGPGGMGGGGMRRPVRPDGPADPQMLGPVGRVRTREAPIAEPNPGEKERPFRRLSERRETVSRDQDQSQDQTTARKEFQRFVRRDSGRSGPDHDR